MLRAPRPTPQGPVAPVRRAGLPAAPPLMRKAGPCACGGTCSSCRDDEPLQARRAVSHPEDPFECEADAVADAVLRMPDLAVGSAIAPGRNTLPRVSRMTAVSDGAAIAPDLVDRELDRPGRPLDPSARRFFEPRFAYDFSRVRVHDDAGAATSARAVDALAYTVGPHIVFDQGRYAPQTTDGRRLLAHELTHVVQQAGGAAGAVQRDARADEWECSPAHLSGLGTKFRKSEAEAKALGLPVRYVTGYAGTEGPPADFVLYCPHKSTKPLKALVPCSTAYWIGDAEASKKGRGKDEVWARQDGEADYYWGYVKKSNIASALTTECTPGSSDTTSPARPTTPAVKPRFAIHSERTDPTTTMGHAFVSLTDEHGKQEKWGFYPACAACTGFGSCGAGDQAQIIGGQSVAGQVCNDAIQNPSNSYEKTITPTEYAEGRKQILDMEKSPKPYNLLTHSCVGFVEDVGPLFGAPIPDLSLVDDPDDLADHIDSLNIADGTFAIEAIGGAAIDLSKEKPTFKVVGLRGLVHTFKFRWMIADPADNRYAMWNDQGQVRNYQRDPDAYIPDGTRKALKNAGVTDATILCRISPTFVKDESRSRLISLPVTFR